MNKLFLIYKTTNRINSKFYIGAHETYSLDDGYLGSGKLLKRAIRKYGAESFVREILYVFNNRTDMYAKERELVDAQFILNADTYNLKIGGEGGLGFNGLYHLPEYRDRQSRNQKAFFNLNPDARANLSTKSQIGKFHKFMWDTDQEYKTRVTDRLSAGRELSQTESAKYKRKQTMRDINHQSGCKNSQYGTIWISNDSLTESRKIPKDHIIPNGWRRGRI